MNDETRTHSKELSEGGRVLVLASEEDLSNTITSAVREAAPDAQVEVARGLEEAQELVVKHRPDLFVLDLDATNDLGQDFLYDLRTSHPHARAIILTAVHLAAQREQAAGLGAIHFLEKPFPHSDFVDLVGALLHPSSESEGEKFQGTLSDLHIADIIQLKCMSGSSSGLEFTGPQGEKARVFFESGQVRHALAPGKEGVAAFNEIVNWKGGKISEVTKFGTVPQTIDLDWQILLMEAVRNLDETRDRSGRQQRAATAGRKIIVIDDSVMLLNFVKEILAEAGYEVVTAENAEEGLAAAAHGADLILLDYILPDIKGDEVSDRLRADESTAAIPVVYMSGFGSDLQANASLHPNVIGALNKPFTSDHLLKTVESYMPKTKTDFAANDAVGEDQDAADSSGETFDPETSLYEGSVDRSAGGSIFDSVDETPGSVANETGEPAELAAEAGGTTAPWWSTPPSGETWREPQSDFTLANSNGETAGAAYGESAVAPANAYFAGETSFFSFNLALHTIEKQQLTGILRAAWNDSSVDLLARDGKVVLVTTRDPQLYCPEAPITLVNVDNARTEAARARQRENGCPLFLSLAEEDLILREPAQQLVQHYGQKLFAQLLTAPHVRFAFEKAENLPNYAGEIPVGEDIDHWMLSTLRFIQFQDLNQLPQLDPASVPAYTRDGFERVQGLRLTVAEAQFASQFNGARSLQQIAKNLRIDLKFARLTLFRFLALEIVECWPPTVSAKPEKRGLLQRFGRGD